MLGRVLVGLMVVGLLGCDEDAVEIHADDLVLRTVTFVPDEARGGVAEWYYDFPDYSDVYGCNTEMNYMARRWEIDEGAQAVSVYFDSGWEEYTLTADGDSRESGSFAYDSSVGIQMTGKWTRAASPGCSVAYMNEDSSGGGARSEIGYCVCELGHEPEPE